MEEQFDLPVEYKGEEHLYKASLVVYGFTHRFHVLVNDQVIIFEPDEERNYRAVLDYSEPDRNKNMDVQLLKKIAEVIEMLIK